MHTLNDDFKEAYDITDVLDFFSGGQKFVAIAVDGQGKKYAIKTFKNRSPRDTQEVALLQKFNDLSGISKIVKVEEYKGDLVIFEEYIDAPDLEEITATYAGDTAKVSALIKNLAETLRPIWSERIVHRDLKPKNIKVLANGEAVIMDFGIARDLSSDSITATGEDQPMTWNFASPEQYAGDKTSISYRTDFFVLGLIGYFLYYQKHPFGTTRDDVAARYASSDNTITSDDTCPLNPFFLASMAFDPSLRPRNVDDLTATLPI